MPGMPAALLYLPIAAMTWRRPVPPPRTAVSLLVLAREVGKGLKPWLQLPPLSYWADLSRASKSASGISFFGQFYHL